METKTILIRNTGMGTKTKIRLCPTTLFLLIISLKLRPLRKISIKEAVEEAIQPMGSIPPS